MNKKQLSNILLYCQENGGITLTAHGKQALFEKGYQVAIKEHEHKTQADKITVEKVNEYLQIANKKHAFLGLWLDNGIMYLDISYHVNIKPLALSMGRKEKQLSIYEWGTGVCLPCDKDE